MTLQQQIEADGGNVTYYNETDVKIESVVLVTDYSMFHTILDTVQQYVIDNSFSIDNISYGSLVFKFTIIK
jgi:hypothetical protein